MSSGFKVRVSEAKWNESAPHLLHDFQFQHLIRFLARCWNVRLNWPRLRTGWREREIGFFQQQQQLKHDDYQVSRGRRFSSEIVSICHADLPVSMKPANFVGRMRVSTVFQSWLIQHIFTIIIRKSCALNKLRFHAEQRTGLSKRKVAKLRESSAWLLLAGA